MADMPAPKTLFDKIWDAHLVHTAEDGTCLLYIDRHLVHEVTSPQAIEGLRAAGRKVRSPELTTTFQLLTEQQALRMRKAASR